MDEKKYIAIAWIRTMVLLGIGCSCTDNKIIDHQKPRGDSNVDNKKQNDNHLPSADSNKNSGSSSNENENIKQDIQRNKLIASDLEELKVKYFLIFFTNNIEKERDFS